MRVIVTNALAKIAHRAIAAIRSLLDDYRFMYKRGWIAGWTFGGGPAPLLFRRLQDDAVAPVDPLDRAIFAQAVERLVDGLAQLVVRADHADRHVPAQIGLALVEAQDAHRVARVRQVEIAGGARRHRRRIDLVIGHGFETVDLEAEGRCRHMA